MKRKFAVAFALISLAIGVGWQVTAAAYGPHAPEIQTSASVVRSGESVHVSCEHFKPGETITLTLGHTVVGTTTAGSDGGCSTSIRIPTGLTGGGFKLVASGSSGDSALTHIRVEKTGPKITSADGTTATIGQHFSFQVTATGSPTPTFSESGGLPNGVAFGPHGLLSGDPANGSASVYKITITATNSLGSDTHGFTLRVN